MALLPPFPKHKSRQLEPQKFGRSAETVQLTKTTASTSRLCGQAARKPWVTPAYEKRLQPHELGRFSRMPDSAEAVISTASCSATAKAGGVVEFDCCCFSRTMNSSPSIWMKMSSHLRSDNQFMSNSSSQRRPSRAPETAARLWVGVSSYFPLWRGCASLVDQSQWLAWVHGGGASIAGGPSWRLAQRNPHAHQKPPFDFVAHQHILADETLCSNRTPHLDGG